MHARRLLSTQDHPFVQTAERGTKRRRPWPRWRLRPGLFEGFRGGAPPQVVRQHSATDRLCRPWLVPEHRLLRDCSEFLPHAGGQSNSNKQSLRAFGQTQKYPSSVLDGFCLLRCFRESFSDPLETEKKPRVERLLGRLERFDR